MQNGGFRNSDEDSNGSQTHESCCPVYDDGRMQTRISNKRMKLSSEVINGNTVENWTKEQTLSLIEHLRENPVLYRTIHPDYTKTKKKNEALIRIAVALKNVKPGVTANMLRKKIKSLNRQLNIERQNMLNFIIESTGTEEDYNPTLWCYSHLQFMIDANDEDTEIDASVNDSGSSIIDCNKTITSEEENSDENDMIVEKEEQSIVENWTREQTLLLINELRKYPLLYDSTNPDYMKINKRSKALRRIAATLEDEKPGITIKMLKNKIKTLNRQIRSEKKRKLHFNTNKMNSGENYIPTLWCFSHLQFMLDANTDESSNVDSNKENWTKEQTLSLINELREYPVLYKTTHPNYVRIKKRNEAFRNIATALENVKPGVTISSVRKKIKTLTYQIKTEKNRMLSFKNSDNNTGEDYTPKLWCYSNLQFILDANAEVDEVAENSNIDSSKSTSSEEEYSDEEVIQHSNKIPDRSFDTVVESFHKSAINSLEKVAAFFSKNKDEDILTKEDLFCSMLCAELKGLKLEETYYDVTTEILQIIKTAKAKERNLLQK